VHGRIVRIPKHRNPGDARNQLFEQLQPLAGDFRGEQADAGDIAAGLGEAGDKSNGNRIAAERDDRNGLRLRQRCACRLGSAADDDCDFAGDQFGGESVQLARLARASIFDEQVLPLDVTEAAQTLAKRIRTQIAEADR